MNRRIVWAAALSLLSAVLLIVIWPSYGNLWWLTFVAFVPMYVAQYRLLPRRWSAIPVAVAFAAYDFAMFLHGLSVMALWKIAVLAAGSALIGLIVGIFLRPFAERTGYRWFVLQLPLLIVTMDLLLQNNEIFGTYPFIAYRLTSAPELAQAVSITGPAALSLLLHVINAAIALVIIAAIDRRHPGLSDVPVPAGVLRWSVAIPVAAAAVWTIASVLIYRDVTDRMGPAVRVAAVQPGLDNAMPGTLISATPKTGRTEDQRNDDQIVQLSAMTREAAAKGAKVVVWPEETLSYDPRATRTEWIPALVRETGVYLAMGFTPDGNDATAPNTGLLWSPQGEVKFVYYKTKRVLVEGEAFTPGNVYPTESTPQGVLGMVICFDIDFPDGPSREEARNGAQMILAPSIDFSSIADLRSSTTAFRAMEHRVAMVKADVAWDSVIAAPNGRVLMSTAMHAESGGSALLVTDVPLGPRGAPFTRFGGAPFQWLAYAATALMLFSMVVSRRRQPQPDGDHVAVGPPLSDN